MRENRGAEVAEGAECGDMSRPHGGGYRGTGGGLCPSPDKFYFFFILKWCILVHFCILILKFYLQSNAAKYFIVEFLAIDSDRDITRNSSADEIANVNLFMTTSYTYHEIQKGRQKQTVKQLLNSPQ